jgi:hypothetical protein
MYISKCYRSGKQLAFDSHKSGQLDTQRRFTAIKVASWTPNDVLSTEKAKSYFIFSVEK